MTEPFAWSELDAELEDLMVQDDTGAVVRRQLSQRISEAFMADYAMKVRVEIWGPDSLIHSFMVTEADWLGSVLNHAVFLRNQLAFGFGCRQEVIEV